MADKAKKPLHEQVAEQAKEAIEDFRTPFLSGSLEIQVADGHVVHVRATKNRRPKVA